MPQPEPTQTDSNDVLAAMARRYLWWQKDRIDEVPPRRIVAQLMNIGDYDDVLAVLNLLGEAPFRDALANAEAGWLSPKSWSYWHLRLGLREPGEKSPPLPARRTE